MVFGDVGKTFKVVHVLAGKVNISYFMFANYFLIQKMFFKSFN